MILFQYLLKKQRKRLSRESYSFYLWWYRLKGLIFSLCPKAKLSTWGKEFAHFSFLSWLFIKVPWDILVNSWPRCRFFGEEMELNGCQTLLNLIEFILKISETFLRRSRQKWMFKIIYNKHFHVENDFAEMRKLRRNEKRSKYLFFFISSDKYMMN